MPLTPIMILAAEATIPQLTAGLGVIAVALVVGQYLVYRFIVTPERDRSTKALSDEVTRATKALSDEVARSAKALSDEVARSAKALSDEMSRSERLEAEVRRQNEVLQEKALPALVQATMTVGESQALLRELRREQEIASQLAAREEALKQRGV